MNKENVQDCHLNVNYSVDTLVDFFINHYISSVIKYGKILIENMSMNAFSENGTAIFKS